MKHKNFGVKALVLALCFVLSLSSLFSCVSDEQMEDVNTKVEDINTELDALENGKVDKATYDALDAFVKEIDVIAKAAVSTEKFDVALNNLNASIATKADAAKVSEDIAAAKNALVEMINANAAEDATTKEALDAALVKITALEGDVATKAALDSAISGINSTIAGNKASVEAKIAEIETLVAAKADKATVDAALAELAGTIASNKSAAEKAIADAKTELEGKLATANTALDELAGTVASNKTAVEKAIADAKSQLESKLNDANNAIEALATVVESNNAKVSADVEDLNKSITALQAATDANAKEIADLEAEYLKKVAELEAAGKATDEALDALKAKYTTDLEALNKADADNKAALEKKIADEISAVNATVTSNASAANEKINALETKVDGIDSRLDTEIANINNTLESKISALKTELNNKVDALEESYNSFVANTNTEISNIKNLIETINAQIEALQKDSSSFAENYQKATDMLYEGEYSIDNFNAIVATILAEDYEESEYEEFEKAVERLRFFLNRAITVDAIKGYFTELQTLIDKMPTLVESLTNMLNAYTDNAPEGQRKYLTTNPKELDSINNVYNKIDTVEEELDALYTAIEAAHANLVAANGAAEDVKVNINNIATPIVYTTSEAAIVYAENAFAAYSDTYFADAEMTKFYGETTAASLVSNYAKLAEYRAYYDNLVEAAANKVEFSEVILNYNTVRPLWKDLETIEADAAKYTEWLATYEIDVTIDAASIATIYGEELGLLTNAGAYATNMTAVYTDNGVESLVAQITEYVCATNVLYNTKDVCAALNAACEELKVAIEAVDGFAAEYDNNYVTMLTQDNIDKLAAVTARIAELVEAKAAIDVVYAEMDALLNKEGGITYDDSSVISEFKPTLDALYEQYSISSEKDAEDNYIDRNFVDLATAAEAKYDELIVAYEAVIEEVVTLINDINSKLDSMSWLLRDGKEIQGLVDDLSRFIFEYEVTTVDLWLPGGDENLEVDLSQLLNKYNKAAANYKLQAKKAESAATSVNAAIELLASVNANDIKNNAIIKDAYVAFEAWCEAYLAADIAAAGSVADAIAEIQNISVFGEKDTYYVFVSVENYEAVLKAYTTANDAMTAAEAAWGAISADMAVLVAGWDIHSYEDKEVNFVAVKAAYDAYLVTYYDNVIDADTDVFGELDAANAPAFEAEMTACKTALDNAGTAAEDINAKIEALPAVTTETAADVLALIAEIRADIADYEQTYCTDNCMFGDNIFKLYQIEKYAEIAKAVNEAYAYADTELEVAELDNILAMAEQQIMEKATTEEGVDLAYNMNKSTLDSYIAETLMA